MANFDGVRITDAGQALLAGVLAGQTLTFTRFVVGDGTMPGSQRPETMTAVVSPRLEASITSVQADQSGQTATVSARFDNTKVSSPIRWSEIGLYAKGPTGGEVLYSYGYDSDPATISPAGPSALEYVISIVTAIGNDVQVTAVFDPDYQSKIYSITKTDVEGMWDQSAPDLVTGRDTYYLDQPGVSVLVNGIKTKIQDLAPSTKVDDVTIQNVGGTLSVKDGGIGTAKIADKSVTDAKLADASVTTDKLANASVTSDKLADGAITASKLAPGAVTADVIDTETITPAAIGAAPATHTHDASAITSGTLPVERGGTGCTTIDGVRTAVLNYPTEEELKEYLGLS